MFHLSLLEIHDGVDRNVDYAVLHGCVAHLDEAVGAAKESVLDIVAKAAVSDDEGLSSSQFAIEPVGPINGNLSLEVLCRKSFDHRTITALSAIVNLAALDDIDRYLPVIVVETFDMSCPAQSL